MQTLKPVVSKLLLILTLFACCKDWVSSAAGEDELAKTIVEKADRVRFPHGGYQVNVKITTSAPGRDPEVRDYEILTKGNDRTIILTLSPASDKGQVLLMRDHDLWAYLPNISQPIRLSVAQKLTGQVANGDLARANFSGDYTPTVLKTETVDGESLYLLELKAVDRSVTYDRVLYWVNKNNFRPFKAEFYAVSGRLLKTCRFQNFRDLGGSIRPTMLVMEDALMEGSKSVLDYSDLKPKDLPDRMFAKDSMRRLQ